MLSLNAADFDGQERSREIDIGIIIEPANVDGVVSQKIHAGWYGRCRRAKIGSNGPARLEHERTLRRTA